MTPTRVAALLENLPQRPFPSRDWVEHTLRREWPEVGPAGTRQHDDEVRAWAVGSVIGNETLVQSRPVVRAGAESFLDDFLRAEARCTIALFASSSSDTPRGIEMARYTRWVGCLCVEPGESIVDDRDVREALLAELPDFIKRGLVRSSFGEIVVLRLLAALHDLGALGSTYSDPASIREALSSLESSLETRGLNAYNLMAFDGRTFSVIHRLGSMAMVRRPPREDTNTRQILPGARRREGVLLVVGDGQREVAPTEGPLPLDEPVRVEPGAFTIDPTAPLDLVRG